MKKIVVAMISFVSLLPSVGHAAVITTQDLENLQKDAVALADGCKLIDFALNTQGSMTSVPEWKTVKLQNATVRIPWSPTWYLVGKQIPWYGVQEENNFSVGRYVPGENCTPHREYNVSVFMNETIKNVIASNDTSEYFTLNGNKAIIVHESALTDMIGIAVEIPVTKKITKVVYVTREGTDINSEMLRMAASAK